VPEGIGVNTVTPLSQDERDELEGLISMRNPPFSSGLMKGSITCIHGFLTGIVSGPIAPPSEWLPLIVGDGTQWEAMEQTERAMTLLVRLLDETVSDLSGGDRRFSIPTDRLGDLRDSGATLSLAQDWCRGYAFGMLPRERDWNTAVAAPELKQVFIPIIVLTQPGSSPALDFFKNSDAPTEILDRLARYVVTIYEWWQPKLARSSRPAPLSSATGTVRRTAPKISPNAPCPCGSGKKHKRCCTQARTKI
jgi:uncharacterized protein